MHFREMPATGDFVHTGRSDVSRIVLLESEAQNFRMQISSPSPTSGLQVAETESSKTLVFAEASPILIPIAAARVLYSTPCSQGFPASEQMKVHS